jgi:hypothetical protein
LKGSAVILSAAKDPEEFHSPQPSNLSTHTSRRCRRSAITQAFAVAVAVAVAFAVVFTHSQKPSFRPKLLTYL